MNNVFVDEKVENLFTYVSVDAELKVTVFTRLSKDNGLLLCVSDGCEVYTNEMFEDNLNTLAQECGFSTREDFIKQLRTCISSKSLGLSKIADHVIVQFEKGATSFNLKCHLTTAVERKRLLKCSYLTMAENLDERNKTITTLKDEIRELRTTTQTERQPVQTASIFEPDVKRHKVVKAKVTKGSSLVNPGTRRKKAASGVVFDDE